MRLIMATFSGVMFNPTLRICVVSTSGGNDSFGIRIQNLGSDNNWIAGNFIGTDASGTLTVENQEGIRVDNSAANNLIGTDGDGVSDSGERNIVSGNVLAGVRMLNANQTTTSGNYIGTDVGGTVSVPNGRGSGAGFWIQGTSTGNVIGTGGDGSPGDADEGNVIAGNDYEGIRICNQMTGTTVIDNVIGRDAGNTFTIGNGSHSIQIYYSSGNTIGGTNPNEGNVIAGSGRGVVRDISGGIIDDCIDRHRSAQSKFAPVLKADGNTADAGLVLCPQANIITGIN